jgi:hypothetical protein
MLCFEACGDARSGVAGPGRAREGESMHEAPAIRRPRHGSSVAVAGRLAVALLAGVLAACGSAPSLLSAKPPTSTGSAVASPSEAPAAASPTENAAASQASPSGPVSPPARTLVVDTDVAPDDLAALSFLVSSPNVTIAAITVSGTGEAHCAGGVDVVLRLLDRLDAPAIPVACGRETPLAGTHAFPDAWRQGADSGSGLAMLPTSRTPSTDDAVSLISSSASTFPELTVLTLGPLPTLPMPWAPTPRSPANWDRSS